MNNSLNSDDIMKYEQLVTDSRHGSTQIAKKVRKISYLQIIRGSASKC